MRLPDKDWPARPDVVLVNPACDMESAVGSFKEIYSLMPPINLAYLAAVLEQRGLQVGILDEAAERLSHEAIADRIRQSGIRVVGIPSLTQAAPRAERLARLIRERVPEAIIVFGNLHASFFCEHYLRAHLADVVVHGEGEETLAELVPVLLSGKSLHQVRGISFLEEGRIVRTEDRPYLNNLDAVPFPAWHRFPLRAYELFSFARVKTPGTLILGSRGCPYDCSFCSLMIMGTKRRKRSVESLVAEFEWLHETFGYRQISFIDPIFPISKKEGFAFCDLMQKRGLHRKVVWTTETRVDLVSPELLHAMREAGCRRVMFGFEAGDDVTLANIKQKVTVSRAAQAARWTRAAGMEVIGFFMVGIPGETRESAEKTIRFACELPVDFAKFNVFVPYPGTRDYAKLKSEGVLEGVRWEQYTSYPTPKNPPSYVPDDFTAQELMRLQREAVRRFYLRPRFIARHLFRIRTIPLGHMFKGGMAILRSLREAPATPSAQPL